MLGAALTGLYGFIYVGLLNTTAPVLVFIAIVVSLIPHDIMYGPQAALIAECFPGRLRYSGASIGYQLASVIAGGPAPLIVAWLLAEYKSGWVIARFILVCAIISLIATALLPDYTNRDIPERWVSLHSIFVALTGPLSRLRERVGVRVNVSVHEAGGTRLSTASSSWRLILPVVLRGRSSSATKKTSFGHL